MADPSASPPVSRLSISQATSDQVHFITLLGKHLPLLLTSCVVPSITDAIPGFYLPAISHKNHPPINCPTSHSLYFCACVYEKATQGGVAARRCRSRRRATAWCRSVSPSICIQGVFVCTHNFFACVCLYFAEVAAHSQLALRPANSR